MRILLSCLQSVRKHEIPAYSYWHTYFVHGVEEAGHEVLEVPGVDWAEGLTHAKGEGLETWRATTWDAVEQYARHEHAVKPIDLFIGYLFPQQVETAAIQELQRIGIPCVNFFCDNVREFLSVPEQYKPFALHWVPEVEALPMYRKAGLPFLHVPMPCWVPPELRQPAGKETEPATFIGSVDELRLELLGGALLAGADFVLRGRGWLPEGSPDKPTTRPRKLGATIGNQISVARQFGWRGLATKLETRFRPLRPPAIPVSRLGPALSREEYVRVSREARVAIGVNRVTTPTRSAHRPLVYSRLRDVEAPMLGACYLTEWTSGLETMYEQGVEIETYRTPTEMADKLTALLKDPERRKTMRERGQRRALGEHGIGETLRRIGAHFGC